MNINLLDDHGSNPLARMLCTMKNNMVCTTADLDARHVTALEGLARANGGCLGGVVCDLGAEPGIVVRKGMVALEPNIGVCVGCSTFGQGRATLRGLFVARV